MFELNNLEHISKEKGVKDGFQVMITVTPFSENIKTEVDFAVRESYHGLGCLKVFRIKVVRKNGSEIIHAVVSASLTPAVDFIPDGNSTDIIFLVQYFIQKIKLSTRIVRIVLDATTVCSPPFA